MATDLAKLVVRLEAESARLQKGLDQANSRLKGFERRADTWAAKVKKTLGGAFVGVGVGLGFAALTGVFRRTIDEADQVDRQMRKLDAIIKSTGQSAGLTADDIDKFSRSLAASTLASTAGVRDAAGVLLTFRSISGETFKETLTLAQDLAATLGTDLKGATLQLGKALEDPATGLTALRRSGVSFTQAEQDLIKSLQESGRAFEAQSLILDKVRQQVGGAGAGEAGGLSGAVDTLSQRWGEFLEAVGNSAALDLAVRSVNSLARAIENLNRLIFTPEPERFNELFEQKIQLEIDLANPRIRGKPALRQQLAEVEAEMRALQDRNFERIKARRDAEIAAEVENQRRIEELRKAAQGGGSGAPGRDKAAEAARKENERFAASLSSLLDDLDPAAAATREYLENVALLDRAWATGAISGERYQELLQTLATDVEALANAEKQLAADRERATDLIKGLDPGSSIRDQIFEVQRLRDTFPELSDALADVELELQSKWDEIGNQAADAAEKTKSVWEQLGPTFSSAFEDAIVSGKKFGDVLKGLEQDIIRIITRKAITEPLGNAIGGMFGGSSGDGFLSSIFGNLFGGARAMGGPVSAGRAYLVGEQGPELFMPRGNGQIMPAGQTAKAVGNTFNFTFSIPTDNADHRRTAHQVAREAARHMQIAQGAV